MNFTLIIFYILIIVSLVYISILYKTYLPYAIHFLDGSNLNEKKPIWDKGIDRLRTAITLSLYFTSIFGFRIVNNIQSYFNNDKVSFVSLIILLIIVIACIHCHKNIIWTNAFKKKYKANSKIQEKKTNNISNKKCITIKETQSVDLKDSDIDKFKEVCKKLEGFDFFNKNNNQFELSNFKIGNNKSLEQKQAWLILIVFWFEDRKNSKSYLDNLQSKYYNFINDKYLQNDHHISKQNWGYFKKKYLIDFQVNDLKKSEFYTCLVKFYKKIPLK